MTAELADRLPPHDRAAERGVLGGILRDPDVLPDVQAVLAPGAFYFDAHQKVYRACCDLAAGNHPIDLVSVFEALRASRQAGDVGGAEGLAELWEGAATGANVMYHAALVRDCAAVRALIHAANEILRDAYDRAAPADELLAAAERRVMAIADASTAAADTVRPAADLISEAIARVDERAAAGGTALAGIATGYADLDEVLGGLRDGELLVVGARPSVGKTALCLNLAANAALSGLNVLFFSLEMPAAEIADRLLSMGSGVAMNRLARPAGLGADDAARVARVSSGIGAAPLWVDDTPDQPAARVAAVTRRAVRRHAIQLVVVDYLQLMRPENPRDNRTQQVGQLALRMKHLARDCGIPVVVPSQLNREVEHRPGQRPRLSDLRESGDVEAHADRVLLLHREPDVPAESEVWPIDVIVGKNRNGPVGDVTLAYRRPVMRFENMVRGESW